MTIVLKPTHSIYANPESIPVELARAPIRLMQHQVQTYQAVRGRVADVIFHSGTTGDGKSLAGFLASLIDEDHTVLAMYPTNELITDQKRHLEEYAHAWDITRVILELNAQELDRQVSKQEVDRATALLSFLNRADILLTNPDVFHYMVTGRYHKQGYQPLHILQQMMFHFKQVTIDEFHLFDQAQTTALLTAMIFIKHVCGNRAPIFVLQSATPDDTFKDALMRGGLTFHTIEGSYSNTDDADRDMYRPILRRVSLSLTSEPLVDWIKDHAAENLHSALANGRGKGAVLFTGVFSALEALPIARAALDGLSVLPNTGLTPPSVKITSRHADLLIGTGTVDTGVDLEINRLVFEANDADNFKQRLGRLGRHTGYTDQAGTTHAFADFAAVVCVPAWIAAAITDEAQQEMTRDDFFALVYAAYGGKRGQIYAYNRLWGWLLAYDLINQLGHPAIKAQYEDVRSTIQKSLSAALQVELGKRKAEFKAFQEDTEKKRLKREVFTFRGSSALTALIVNEAYSGSEKYQFYDLLSVLPRIDFNILDYHLTCLQAERDGVPKLTMDREDPVIALRWQGVSQERRRLILELDSGAWRAVESKIAEGVFVTTDLMVRTDPYLPLGEPALKQIRSQSVAVRIVMNHTPADLQRWLRLGTFFPLHRFETHVGGFGTIALGREALLLDAAVAYLREEDPGALVV